MANLSELFRREVRISSNLKMQRDLLEALQEETDEESRATILDLLKKLKEEETTLRD